MDFMVKEVNAINVSLTVNNVSVIQHVKFVIITTITQMIKNHAHKIVGPHTLEILLQMLQEFVYLVFKIVSNVIILQHVKFAA